MKRFLKNRGIIKPRVDERITDAMLGTGEHMCSCAAIVADIIIDQGQENLSIRDMLGKIDKEDVSGSSTAEKKS